VGEVGDDGTLPQAQEIVEKADAKIEQLRKAFEEAVADLTRRVGDLAPRLTAA